MRSYLSLHRSFESSISVCVWEDFSNVVWVRAGRRNRSTGGGETTDGPANHGSLLCTDMYIHTYIAKGGTRKGHASYLQCRVTLVQQGVDLCGEHFLIQK